jgi:hypothetical protein
VLLTLVLCVLTIMSVFNNSLFVERNEKWVTTIPANWTGCCLTAISCSAI